MIELSLRFCTQDMYNQKPLLTVCTRRSISPSSCILGWLSVSVASRRPILWLWSRIWVAWSRLLWGRRSWGSWSSRWSSSLSAVHIRSLWCCATTLSILTHGVVPVGSIAILWSRSYNVDNLIVIDKPYHIIIHTWTLGLFLMVFQYGSPIYLWFTCSVK